MCALMVGVLSPLVAQDTTQFYPWRLSYFPYVTASPNDGVMAMGRVVFFRQSRWDDRVSLYDEVAVEGGYSTKDSWLLHARGDFPRLAPGWRLQLVAQAERDAQYEGNAADSISALRQFVAAEVSRSLGGPFLLAVRGEASHVGIPAATADVTETDIRGRIAVVVDQRDREYDTRSGSLIQGGFFFGSPSGTSSSYTGEYGMASGWLPLSERTRVTARVAARFSNHLGIDASRVIPAWEDDVLVAGGPESNRALPIAARVNDCAYLASAEIRHDLRTFPGGALALLAFVDGTHTDNCGRDNVSVGAPNDTLPGLSTTTAVHSNDGWVLGPGVGVSLRLLRNAVLNATVARALGATRIYVSSGWSW